MPATQPALNGRVFRYDRAVSFGDCDPAGIVFYPNFYRWFDEAVHVLLRSIGWSWQRTQAEFGWMGLALAGAEARFLRPATHGDQLRIESRVASFELKRVNMAHRVLRGDDLLCEGLERRFIGMPHPDDPARARAIEIPEALKAALLGD